MDARGKWIVPALAGVLTVAGCGGGGSVVAPVATVRATPSPAPVPGGCGATPVRKGAVPEWAAGANVPDIAYVMSNEGNLVGTLFAGTLRAGHPENPTNKVLWVVREPRQGSPLRLTLRPVQGTAPEVTHSEAPDSGPGEIYPSIVDVPAPGCWHVTAEWNGNRAALDLLYH